VATTENARRGRRPRKNLSLQQERDIIDAYVGTDRSMHELAKAMGLNPTYPYRTLEKWGIKWRRGSEVTWDDYLAENPEVLAKLNAIAVEAPETLDLDEVVTPLVNQIQLIEITEQETWLVEVTEKFLVSANDIDGALQAGKQLRPGGRITSIRIKQ